MVRGPTNRNRSNTPQIRARLEELLSSGGLDRRSHRRLADLLEEMRRDDPGNVLDPGLFQPGRTDPVIDQPGGALRPGAFQPVLDDFGNFIGKPIKAAELSEILKEVSTESLPAPEHQLHHVTSAMMDMLRKARPETLPKLPIPEGGKGAALPISSSALTRLVRLAAIRRLGGQERIIWDDGVNELLVEAAALSVTLLDGQLRIEIPVASDQVHARMRMPFAVGGAERRAGMVIAAPDRPAGNALIARIWGDALIALAYGALVDASESLAGASGRDVRNNRLVPRALTARRDGFTVESQARFEIGRTPK